MGSTDTLRLAVFGPSRFAAAEGQAGPEPTTTQRRILERLALHAPAATGISELIDAVWEDDPPRHARAAIQNQISRIRSIWGEEVVVTVADGYVLGVGTDAALQRDLAARAEIMLERGEAAAAFDYAEAVLPLWSGRPFLSIGHVPGVDAARRGLSATCKGAENTRLSAAIALGRTGWAIAEAERLVAETPLDELRRSLLVDALAAAGRRGDALAALATARRAIRDGLGIAVGPHLEAAEASILRGRVVAHDMSLPYVGRRQQLRLVLSALATEGAAVVHAEPGGGLTRFLDAIATQLASLGVVAVCVNATDHLDAADGVLRQVLHEAGVTVPATVVSRFADDLALIGASRPLSVVVDDAHVLGPTTWSALIDASGRTGVSVVLGTHQVAAAPGAIALDPLTPGDVAEVLRLGGDDPDRAPELAEASGGNPLALALLYGDDVRDRTDPAPGLAALARQLLAGLSHDERALVERIAVFGDDAALAPAALIGAAGAFTRTDGPLPAILTRQGDTVRFRHGILRDLVRREMPPALREELHLEGALAARAAGAPPVVTARHALAAGSLAGELAVESALAAAEAATAVGAHSEAAQWYERVLHRGVDPDIGVRIRHGDALRLAGDPRHLDVLERAADDAIASGDETLIAAACASAMRLGAAVRSGSSADLTHALLERAIPQLQTPQLRAPVLAAASLALSMTGEAERCRDLFDEAERIAIDPGTRATVLPSAYMSLGMPDDLDRRRTYAHELLAIGAEHTDAAVLFEGWQLQASVAIQEGDGETLRRADRELTRLAAQAGDVGRRWGQLFVRAAVAHLDGDEPEAESATARAEALFGQVSPSRALSVSAAQRLALRLTDGRAAELAPLLADLTARQPGVPAWHAAFALALAHSDQHEAARDQARLALANPSPDVTWLATYAVTARALARTGGADDLAPNVLGALAPWSGRAVWQGSCCFGPVDSASALLHEQRGDGDAARGAWERARTTALRLEAEEFAREAEDGMRRCENPLTPTREAIQGGRLGT